mgnify:CR=1 FL=1
MKGKHTHFSILFILALLMCNTLQAAINDRYTLVTSADELADGDEFIIVDKEYAQTVGLFKTSTFEGCSVTLKGNDAVISNANTTIFILKKAEKNSYIKTQLESNYLSGNNDKDEIKLTPSISSKDLYKVKFNFDSQKHNVKIEIGSKKYKHFWCNKKNDGTYVWKIYDTSTSPDTYIYKKASSATTTDITLDGLNAEAKNVEALNGYEGKIVDKITINRSFAADGGWYTLCLPFALTADDIKTTFKDALFNEFESVSVNAQGVAQLKFKKVTETKAGVPYMVLPRGTTVEKPVFNNKTIGEIKPQTITRTCKASDGEQLSYQFVGVYDPTVVSGENNVRFVGGNQGTELLIPDGKGTIKGLRAYFVFPNSSEGIITQAKLNIDDDSTTGIISINAINANHSNETNIYTLSGQQVSKNQKTLKPGIFIKHGKKIIVR